mmetsp:Transcript_31694/g.90939  ORF Transcript_31694/g.90939 Transcript_31694/m.90939 type:complete len:278 (+) Transcript_31694:1054-1887(+)
MHPWRCSRSPQHKAHRASRCCRQQSVGTCRPGRPRRWPRPQRRWLRSSGRARNLCRYSGLQLRAASSSGLASRQCRCWPAVRQLWGSSARARRQCRPRCCSHLPGCSSGRWHRPCRCRCNGHQSWNPNGRLRRQRKRLETSRPLGGSSDQPHSPHTCSPQRPLPASSRCPGRMESSSAMSRGPSGHSSGPLGIRCTRSAMSPPPGCSRAPCRTACKRSARSLPGRRSRSPPGTGRRPQRPRRSTCPGGRPGTCRLRLGARCPRGRPPMPGPQRRRRG